MAKIMGKKDTWIAVPGGRCYGKRLILDPDEKIIDSSLSETLRETVSDL